MGTETGMTIKRVILGVLTVVALFLVSLSLVESWNEPQVQSRLELYQTNLILHAAEWRGEKAETTGAGTEARPQGAIANSLIGDDGFETALKQYQEAREKAQQSLEKTQAQLQQLQAQAVDLPRAPKPPAPETPVVEISPMSQQQQLQALLNDRARLLCELDLRLGILQVQKEQTAAAIATWTDLIERSPDSNADLPLVHTANVLAQLWQSRIIPDAEPIVKQNLDGWFRYRALSQLYQLQERKSAIATLQAEEQKIAQQAVLKLAIVAAIPGLGFLIGTALLIILLIQRLVKGKESLLAKNGELSWAMPWDAETVWQVLIVGFFFVGQILVPFTLKLFNSLLNIHPEAFDARSKAFYILGSYILLATGGLLVLYLSIKPFYAVKGNQQSEINNTEEAQLVTSVKRNYPGENRPSSLLAEWFSDPWRGNWFLWGVGGYFVALPLVIVVSLINQKLWQGQGGSNPILPIVLEGKDNVALAVFFLTASIGAPLFEEMMFRGFLLPSLTRYMPVGGAIAASALLFAIAHLNVSEVLPLATLGAVLGFVYTRSRNLLAPMLLHSLWNSGTLLSLFILGSS